jgi:hypothetical protein
MFTLSDEQFQKWSTGLAIAVLLLAAWVCMKKMTKKENFASFAAPTATGQCKVAADSYCTQRCLPGGESMSPGKKQALLQDVLNNCGENFRLDAYCYGNYNSCPLTATNLIMGGTHNQAFAAQQLIPQMQTIGTDTKLTEWGLYNWKNEGTQQSLTVPQ